MPRNIYGESPLIGIIKCAVSLSTAGVPERNDGPHDGYDIYEEVNMGLSRSALTQGCLMGLT